MVCVLALAAGPALGADEALLLDVQVNGYPTGKIGAFTLRGASLLSKRSELTDLGFRLPLAVAMGADDLVALSDLPGVTWRLDEPTQTVFIAAAASILQPTVLQPSEPSGASIAIESATGATLNYDVSAVSGGRQAYASGLFDLRGFSRRGVVSSGLLVRAGNGQSTNSAVRLDTTYTYSSPVTDRRYRLGDVISGSVNWTRAVRLAGVQVTSDFSMRPDLVTFPVPTLRGVAAVPSTLDVIANGSTVLSRQVGAGPFEIPQLPVATGANAISMTLTDALGRQVVTALPFYASSSLLAPGLQTYAIQAGAVRRSFGELSNDYGPLAASVAYRRGVTPALTLEGSAEGASGVFMAGVGLTMNIADVVILDAAAAASTGASGPGTQVTLGVQHFADVFSFGLSATLADRRFRDVAAMNGEPPPRLQLAASVGLSLGRFGSASLLYAGLERDSQGPSAPTRGSDRFRPVDRTRILSANYSVQVGRLSIYAVGFGDLEVRHSNGVLIGLTLPLGARTSASLTATRDAAGDGLQAQVVRTPVVVGDLGYQGFASTGGTPHAFAEAAYKAPWALVTAGVDRLGSRTSLRAGSAGAISIVDHRLFASNTIYDSFAIVDTNGLGHVRVLSENRDAGRTNAAGLLLVPDLRAFGVNHIDIAPVDVPLDVTIDNATREVRPQDRSGVWVRFPVRVSHGALLRLVDDAGLPLPVGSVATLLKPPRPGVPVGYDGEAYVENLQPHNELLVERPDGRRCQATFDYHATAGDLPVIGPLICTEYRP